MSVRLELIVGTEVASVLKKSAADPPLIGTMLIESRGQKVLEDIKLSGIK